MKTLLFLVIMLSFLCQSFATDKMIRIKNQQNFIVLKADKKDMHTKVLLPKNYNLNKITSVNFDVTYNGFSAQAQAAFQHAVNIWSGLITSAVPIKVIAYWTPLAQNVLGSASSSTLYRDFNGAPRTNTWYPAALSEKLNNAGINHPDSADIVANFSSSFNNWYFGTDGNPPTGKYDFVSVVLHELCHGLGFQGSMDVNGGQGSWGFGSGFPFVFDHHTQNGSGQTLLNTSLFPNPSAVLAAQLTGNNIYFSGQNSDAANGGSPVKLFAPTAWESGSSYSHLNESTFPAGNPNSLMTPTIGASEAIHYPGDITLNMFKDMGWTVHFNPINYTDVYPGDTDNNGIVNEADILPIGIYFLKQGFSRNETSFAWEAKNTVIWIDSAATYADVNGDGIVNEIDIIGIGVNWGNSHASNIESFAIDPGNTALLKKYRSNFQQIYNSLSGENEAINSMKSLLEKILGIEKELPKLFVLGTNYPNPFNPKTNIPFELPEKQKVTITIYNNLGQVILVPVRNQYYNAGRYAYEINAGMLPSGIYIYSIKTEKFNQSNTMVVLK